MPIQKILLVDDSKTELHFLSELLTKRGYAVRTAENGEEAMRRLAEEKPDLILMDVVMPGKNGFQLDSKEPTVDLEKYAYNETRYKMLLAQDKTRAEELMASAKLGIAARWNQLKHLAGQGQEASA